MRTIILLIFIVFPVNIQNDWVKKETSLESKMGIVSGTVKFINHPELGEWPANGEEILFQRINYPDVAVGIRTDIDGKYELILTEGKYRVFSREAIYFSLKDKERKSWDWIAPSQERFFTVKPFKELKFDIKVMFPEKLVNEIQKDLEERRTK